MCGQFSPHRDYTRVGVGWQCQGEEGHLKFCLKNQIVWKKKKEQQLYQTYLLQTSNCLGASLA